MNSDSLHAFLREKDHTRILQAGELGTVVRQLLDSCLPLYPTQAGQDFFCDRRHCDQSQVNSSRALDRVVVSAFDYVDDLSRRARILRFFSDFARLHRRSLQSFRISAEPDVTDRAVSLEIGQEGMRLLEGFLSDPLYHDTEKAFLIRDIVHRHLGLLPDFLPDELLDGAPRLLNSAFREYLSDSLLLVSKAVLVQFYAAQCGDSPPLQEADAYILSLGRYFTEFGTANWKLQHRKNALNRW